MKALLIIDLQNDFIEGSLAIKGAKKIVAPLVKYVTESNYQLVIASQDWHPQNHCSFKINGGIWKQHCVQNQWGAQLNEQIRNLNLDYIIKKGHNTLIESYSVFQDFEGNKSQLPKILKKHKITKITLVGLALDYCVFETALDLARFNYDVTIITHLTPAIGNPTSKLKQLKKLKVKLL